MTMGACRAEAIPCRLLMSLESSSEWRPVRVLRLKIWGTIVSGAACSGRSCGLACSGVRGLSSDLFCQGCGVLHRPGDWMTALLSDARRRGRIF